MTIRRVRRIATASSPLASQIVSSLGNFAIVLLCARFLEPSVFGRFALAYSVILLMSQVLRAAVGESALLSKSRTHISDEQVARTMMSGGLAGSILFGVVACLIAKMLRLSTPFALVIGFCAIVVPLTDMARYVYILIRPQTAVLIDVCWASLGLALVVILRANGRLTETSALAVWGASALVTSSLPILQQAPRHIFRSLRLSLKEPGAIRLVLDIALLTGSSLGVLAVLAAAGGSGEVGAFRSAAIPFTWIQIAHSGGYLTVTRRRNSKTLVNRRSLGAAISLGLAACAGTGGVLLLLPTNVGEAMFGKGWVGMTDLAAYVAVQYGTFVLSETMMGAMKIRIGTTVVVKIRLVFAVTLLTSTIVVAKFASARSAILCLTAASLVVAGLAMIALKAWSENVAIQKPT